MFQSLKNLLAHWRSALRSRRREVCPFCFETFRLRDTPFRCVSPMNRCEPEPDEVLKRVWKTQTPMGKVLFPETGFTLTMTCPDCKQRTHKRLCPHCHQELPHTFGEFKNYIFSVIGAKQTGKSHYISVLIRRIQDIGPDLKILLQPVGDGARNRYRRDFYNPLYTTHKALDITPSGLEDTGIQLPMVFTLTFSGRGLFGNDIIKKATTIVFFDTAGEDLRSTDTMLAINKYIYRSDGIILLLDPLQFEYVRNALGADIFLPEKDTETTDMITRLTELIRRGQGLRITKRIKTPLAVALSKLDAVNRLIPQQNRVCKPAAPGLKFNEADFRAIHEEVRELITEWSTDNLLFQLETEFQSEFHTYGFFGLSALGAPPTVKGRVPIIRPHRVEDPFLWLLYRHGLLKKQ